MNTKPVHIHYDDGAVSAELEIRQATTLDGMKRTRLLVEADGLGNLDVDLLVLHTLYPSLVVCTSGEIKREGQPLDWPPTFDQFLSLPEALSVKWEAAAFDMNPHWRPEGAEDGQKKALTTGSPESTNGSAGNQTTVSRKKRHSTT